MLIKAVIFIGETHNHICLQKQLIFRDATTGFTNQTWVVTHHQSGIFCTHSSDVTLWENQRWCHKMLAIF